MANFIAFIQIYSLLHMLLAVVYEIKRGGKRTCPFYADNCDNSDHPKHCHLA